MAEPVEAAKPSPPPAGKGPIIIIMAVLAALIVGGAGGIFFMLKKMPPPAPAGHAAKAAGGEVEKDPFGDEVKEEEEEDSKKEGGEKEGEGADKEEQHGSFMATLTPFLANLNDESGDQRYIKMVLAVELSSKRYLKHLDKQTPRIRNAVLMYLSSLKTGDVLGTPNKKALLDHLRTDVQQVLGKRAVQDVYVTEFVIQ